MVIARCLDQLDYRVNFQLIEAPGFLDDSNDESSLVERMSLAELNTLEAQVEGRIKRKLLALTRLCGGGKTRVIISDGRGEHPVEDAINGKGTHIG